MVKGAARLAALSEGISKKAYVTATPSSQKAGFCRSSRRSTLGECVNHCSDSTSQCSVSSQFTFYKYQSLMTNFLLSRGCGSYRNGNWCSGYVYSCSKTAYLGLKFLVNGQTHYAWAYVTISGSLRSGLSVRLRGFAYETIAGHAINTGQTSGT